MDVLKKFARRHALFVLIGIGDLGFAAYLLKMGSGNAQGVIGASMNALATIVGFLTGIQGCVALALCPGLSALDREEYSSRAVLVVLVGTPLWIIVVLLAIGLLA